MTTNIALRLELEPIPARMAHLAIARGYPVPWFVAWENGEPEFRAADASKFRRAIEGKLCWVCGGALGRYMTFVAGPMCGINRTSAEPPCHLECAQWSARNCPFLSKPHMGRRENGLPDDMIPMPGLALRRNPGVTLLWTTRGYELFGDGMGGVLIQMGEPTNLEWWALGKRATREQVVASVESGLPKLAEVAATQEGATEDLLRRKAWLEERYPTLTGMPQ